MPPSQSSASNRGLLGIVLLFLIVLMSSGMFVLIGLTYKEAKHDSFNLDKCPSTCPDVVCKTECTEIRQANMPLYIAEDGCFIVMEDLFTTVPAPGGTSAIYVARGSVDLDLNGFSIDNVARMRVIVANSPDSEMHVHGGRIYQDTQSDASDVGSRGVQFQAGARGTVKDMRLEKTFYGAYCALCGDVAFTDNYYLGDQILAEVYGARGFFGLTSTGVTLTVTNNVVNVVMPAELDPDTDEVSTSFGYYFGGWDLEDRPTIIFNGNIGRAHTPFTIDSSGAGSVARGNEMIIETTRQSPCTACQINIFARGESLDIDGLYVRGTSYPGSPMFGPGTSQFGTGAAQRTTVKNLHLAAETPYGFYVRNSNIYGDFVRADVPTVRLEQFSIATGNGAYAGIRIGFDNKTTHNVEIKDGVVRGPALVGINMITSFADVHISDVRVEGADVGVRAEDDTKNTFLDDVDFYDVCTGVDIESTAVDTRLYDLTFTNVDNTVVDNGVNTVQLDVGGAQGVTPYRCQPVKRSAPVANPIKAAPATHQIKAAASCAEFFTCV